ncbi:MAG: YkgJ family cysteine cluster protein [Niameybacter sp.]|uniref:YkgJ family cysteine cluster protein n=1 Tax=Niameybacter sp. TaxID=2033640 RepID=UPI002FCC3847
MNSRMTLEGISDGKVYDIEDWVAADAGGCNGCSACCHDVGDLVVLTPFDIYEMTRRQKASFDDLLVDKIELREKNRIWLPHLKMQEETKRCSFLNEEDRCTIHGQRPNICRLFPLGRVYEDDDFKYFLQVGNCTKPSLTKVQVKEWIGIENYAENKAFILAWHRLLKALTFRLKFVRDEEELAAINQYLLDTFYRKLVKEGEDFYVAFAKCLPEAKNQLNIL